MTNIVGPEMMQAVNTAYRVLVVGQAGVVEQSDAHLEDILHALRPRLTRAAAVILDAAVGDGNQQADPVADLAGRAVALLARRNDESERARNHLNEAAELIEDEEYVDAVDSLGVAAGATDHVLAVAAAIAQIRSEVLGTPQSRVDLRSAVLRRVVISNLATDLIGRFGRLAQDETSSSPSQ